MTVCRPLAIVAACVALIGAADPRAPAFGVGIMRRDGMLIPFAAFDGRRWTSGWPAPASSSLEVPVNLASVPRRWWGPTGPLAEWQVWTSASASRVVHVVQPDWVDVHCVRQIGLRTDYRSSSPLPAPTVQPYPKDGLAVSPPHAVDPIQLLSPDSTEGVALKNVVRDAFNVAERETASYYGHPVVARKREAEPVQIEALYAYGSATRTYYVEAARGYPGDAVRSDQCRIAFGTGWFTRGADGRLTKIDMAVDLLPCNRYGATYMLPLGVIREANRVFWLAQYSGWDHERFVVVEIERKKIEAVIVKGGGGC